MNLRANIFAIAVAASSLSPLIAHGQVTAAERTATQGVIGTFSPFRERLGVSQPLPQDDVRTETSASAFKLSDRQSDDRSHFSRTHNVIVGALVGAAVGLGTELLLDHTAKSAGPGSGEQITYTFEVVTIPLGVVIGALTGLLIPSR
jgi:hypothetical protein